MPIDVHLEPFGFPNFLKVTEWKEQGCSFPVAHLSVEQAKAYWDEMKEHWVEHVLARRRAWEAEHPSGFQNLHPKGDGA